MQSLKYIGFIGLSVQTGFDLQAYNGQTSAWNYKGSWDTCAGANKEILRVNYATAKTRRMVLINFDKQAQFGHFPGHFHFFFFLNCSIFISKHKGKHF